MASDVQQRTNGTKSLTVAVSGTGGGSTAINGSINLSSPPLPATEPSLADQLDSHSGDIPSLLNSLLSSSSSSSSSSLPSSSTVDLPALDASLGSLLTNLSLLSQDTSSALESRIADVSRTVPRLSYDLQFMRESATTLQASLALVQGRVHQSVGSASTGNGNGDARRRPGSSSSPTRVRRLDSTQSPRTLAKSLPAGSDNAVDNTEETDDRRRTQKSLDKLAHLDKLKSRMESARDILREAEAWSTLEGEISVFLGDSAWEKAAARLAEASRSMVVFQSTPAEYETRRALLVSLQNGLEAALSAALKDVLEQETGGGSDTATTGHVDGCAKFHDIFATMEREGEFRNYYFAARRKGLLEVWGAYEGHDFAGFLSNWYGVLMGRLEKEREDIGRIFAPGATRGLLAAFLTTTLDALSPSIQSRLASTADALGAVALPELIKAYRSTEETSVKVTELLASATSTFATLASSPRASSPLPISPAGSIPSASVRPGTFKRGSTQITPRFTRLSSAQLDIPLAGYAESTSDAERWETTMYEPFLELQTSYPALERRYLLHLLRSDNLGSGQGGQKKDASVFVDRSNSIFAIAGDAIIRCRQFTHGYGSVGLISALGEYVGAWLDASGYVLDAAPVQQSDELDFGMDYSTEDWAGFQNGLKALQACREVGIRLEGFERKLWQELKTLPALSTRVSGNGQSPGTAALTLLSQSPLYSTSLSTLQSSLSSSSLQPLLPARKALSTLTRRAQERLQGLILGPLHSQLASYPSLKVWEQSDKNSTRRDGISIPTFSLSPTDTIARVSEGLLNLLRVFEVYAKEEALGYSLDTLPFVDEEQLKLLIAASASEMAGRGGGGGGGNGSGSGSGSGTGTGQDDTDGPLLSPSHDRVHTYHDATGAERLMGGDNGTANHIESTSSNNLTPKLAPEAIVSTWISSLALSLLSHLTGTTLSRIPRLTTHGARQLETDLSYLSNAVRALDVEWEELERWRLAAGAGEVEWRGVVGGKQGKADKVDKGGKADGETVTGDSVGEKEKEVWRKVGKMRGWTGGAA